MSGMATNTKLEKSSENDLEILLGTGPDKFLWIKLLPTYLYKLVDHSKLISKSLYKITVTIRLYQSKKMTKQMVYRHASDRNQTTNSYQKRINLFNSSLPSYRD